MLIDISYEQLFDAKTRLKELFDLHRDSLGVLQYEYEKLVNGHSKVQVLRIAPDRERHLLSAAIHPINKALAEQQASEEALVTLAKQGFVREIPTEYRLMLKGITTTV